MYVYVMYYKSQKKKKPLKCSEGMNNVFSSFHFSRFLPPIFLHWRYISSCLLKFWVIILSQFSSVAQSCPTLCAPWIAACQASLSITNSWSLSKLMSIKSVMPSNHLIVCHPLLLPSIFPSIRVFSNESVLLIKWPKY